MPRLIVDKILSLLSDSNQRPRDYKSRALANWAKEAGWVSSLHRAATTFYLCCGQALEDLKGAGRAAPTRLFSAANLRLSFLSPNISAHFLFAIVWIGPQPRKRGCLAALSLLSLSSLSHFGYWGSDDFIVKIPNRNATNWPLSLWCPFIKNSSVGERRAARGGTTRPDERNAIYSFFK